MEASANTRSLLDTLPGSSERRLYRAPGRVNIIGEHTDHTEGFVLPTTSAIYTWVAGQNRDDRTVNIRSLNMNQSRSIDLDNIADAPGNDWSNYVVGVIALILKRGVELRGADLHIETDIPLGGGLSSSAALEVAVATAILDLGDASTAIAAQGLAILCQQAENDYAGVRCGIMDQLAVAKCRRGSAMRLDCRDLSVSHVPIPSDIRLLLTDSGVKHQFASGEYNQRAEECVAATAIVRKNAAQVSTLRDLGTKDVESLRGLLGDTLFRRCRHIASENQRVVEACLAMDAGDHQRLGALISASHRSLRDDFEVSCKEVDDLVETAEQCAGVYGSRMVGGGFGGCVLSVVASDHIDAVIAEVTETRRDPAGNKLWTHVVTPTDAAERVLHS